MHKTKLISIYYMRCYSYTKFGIFLWATQNKTVSSAR